MHPLRKPLIAGNWKMYKTPSQARAFMQSLLPQVIGVDHCDVVVAPPLMSLTTVRELLKASMVRLAAQNCHWEAEGAYTGEVSPAMLIDAGCEFVILGHSERRQYFLETDEIVNRKLRAALVAGLKPIFCLGETLAERESGEFQSVVKRQLEKGLATLTPPEVSRIIIAYEPVWAIGTGRTATPETAQEAHLLLRRSLESLCGKGIADTVRILYGGSVKPGNIAELMHCPDIDGALVGGASLEVESFAAIVKYSS